MLGVVAYFQASAISSLVSASMGGEEFVPPVNSAVAPTESATEGAPILERNPFDSSAGPIEQAEPAEPEQDEPAAGGVSECSKGKVVLIAENPDPNWAFATIDVGSGAHMRRVGDTFGEFTVESLTWDRVYLEENGKRCFLSMGGASLTGRADPAAAPEPTGKEGVRQVSKDTYAMARSTLEDMLHAPGGLLGDAGVKPVKRGDRTVGLELSRVPSRSALAQIGLKRGDVLQSMSGTQITSPEKLLSAYERMEKADTFRLRILRNGAPKQIELQVE